MKKLSFILMMAAAMTLGVSAQTYDGTTGDAIWDIATNWTGDPTVSQGTINSDGVIGTVDPTDDPDNPGNPLPANDTRGRVDGFDVIQNGGTIGVHDFNGMRIDNSVWAINNGAELGGGAVRLNGTAMTVNNGGNLNVSGGRDLSMVGASSLTVNSGGTVTVTDDFTNSGTFIIDGGLFTQGNGSGNGFSNSGTITINSGTLDTSDGASFGADPVSGGGVFNVNGGTITGNRMKSKGGSEWNFGGSTAGTFTVNDWGDGLYTNNGDRQRDNEFLVNFNSGSEMVFTMGGGARALDFTNDSTNNPTSLAWAEALWGEGQLIYTDGLTIVSGLDPDSLGWSLASWADVTNSSLGFGTASNEYFDWTADNFGGTLQLGVIPEPSTFALLFGGLGALFVLRRRS